MIDDPEDEAFNEIERQAQQRKEAVKASVSLNPYRAQVIEEVAQAILEIQARQLREAVKANVSLNPYRAQVIEEVAQAILEMEGFGQDTLNSFAIYIRGLK